MASRLPDAAEDHYRVLGVDRSATADEIKAAYRKQVLLHHPDRAAGKSKSAIEEQGQIQKINAAYDALSDAHARVKYDFEHFGTSTSPDLGNRVAHPHGNYKAMTSQDVDDMFSGLNTFERFSTAKYHAMRSAKAPAAVGRRATGFHERKQFRAAQLPTKNASLAWLGFPVVIVALWAFNLKNVKKSAQREHHLR